MAKKRMKRGKYKPRKKPVILDENEIFGVLRFGNRYIIRDEGRGRVIFVEEKEHALRMTVEKAQMYADRIPDCKVVKIGH